MGIHVFETVMYEELVQRRTFLSAEVPELLFIYFLNLAHGTQPFIYLRFYVYDVRFYFVWFHFKMMRFIFYCYQI